MESILPDLPPLPRRKITLPLSTLAEVARDVCDGYDPPRQAPRLRQGPPAVARSCRPTCTRS